MSTSVAPAASNSANPGAGEILEGLNDEQRSAVTHGEGPLLIVAGAGTGKTQVITRRIAWLIATRRARPEQILALTFTDRAAAEMESRVDVLVPIGLVGSTIATFNAFCDRLVREHAIELGLTSQLRVESQAEILVFLREHLFELGLKRYLPLSNPDSHLHALLGVFDRARNEDVSPGQYLAFAEQLAAQARDELLRDRAEAQLELARAYGSFTDLLMRAGRVDFGSQIGLALRLLRERPYLRREFQERFRWILIDEFQDTNHVQFELIRLLAGDARNLTVVGDDDQSIYRFRGAKVENLMGFLDSFPGARRVLLNRNYRSGQAILDAAHRLIQGNNPDRLEARLGLDKRLIAQPRDSDREAPTGSVEFHPFQTASDQSESIALEIEEAIAAGASAADFAVLARAHHHLDPVAEALRARGIRFRRVGMRGLYARPEVNLCLNVLRSVANPNDGRWPFMALGDPLFGADGLDLASLNARARARHRPLLRIAIDAVDGDPDLGEHTRDAIRRFAALHHQLSQIATSRPTSEVLYAFVRDSGMLQSLAEPGAENLERAQNLNKLFAITTRVGRLLTRDLVSEFMPHLDLLIELGDDPTAADVEGDEQAVSLLTAHGAKGLEFPVVYLVDLTEQRFPQYPKGEPLEFPRELRHAAGSDEKLEHYEEERRLFYVGMTRARDRLVLCHAQDQGGRRADRLSRFVREALGLPEPAKGAKGASALESIARYAPVPDPPTSEPAPIGAEALLRLSHSQIRSFLDCPLQYYYAYVACVPLPSNPTLMYGSAVHQGIKVWNQARLRGIPITIHEVLAVYESEWLSEGFRNLAHEERMKAQGREALERFVRNELASRDRPVLVEGEFNFRIGRDEVNGRWDRIDERKNGVVLVDYKTSQVEEEEKAEERVASDLRDGQLGLYALAYFETRQKMPARVELSFVASGTVGSAEVEPEHLERARERVETAAAGIRRARFDAQPDSRTCARCDYRQICRFSAVRRSS